MTSRKRKGMIVKNTDTRPVTIELATRTIVVRPGDELPITADEVQDDQMRDYLQLRAISIVRPTTDAEEEELRRYLEELSELEDE